MISTYKHKNLVWVDLEGPTNDDVKSLMKKYSIHPLAAEEILKPTFRPRVDVYKKFIYLILHFPVFDPSRKGSFGCEIDFIIGKNFLITVHYKPVALLYEISKLFEVGSLIDSDNLSKNPGMLVFFIVRKIYDFAIRQLDHIQAKIDEIKENMFKGREQEMVELISYVRRDVLDFQKSLHMHENVLNSLETAGKKFFGPDFSHYTQNMITELDRVKSLLYNCKETIEALQNTNDSLLSDKSNDIMKTLSILAFLTFPLMLFAALFSMNTEFTPLLGTRGDFWIILSMMILSMIFMVIVFKRKRWL